MRFSGTAVSARGGLTIGLHGLEWLFHQNDYIIPTLFNPCNTHVGGFIAPPRHEATTVALSPPRTGTQQPGGAAPTTRAPRPFHLPSRRFYSPV